MYINSIIESEILGYFKRVGHASKATFVVKCLKTKINHEASYD